MSLFGYPATVTHWHSTMDDWGRPLPPTAAVKSAKVVEEQKLIRNAKGEEVAVAYAIHLPGVNVIGFDDYFAYESAVGQSITIHVQHYEVRKNIGTNDVKKVIVYG